MGEYSLIDSIKYLMKKPLNNIEYYFADRWLKNNFIEFVPDTFKGEKKIPWGCYIYYLINHRNQ